MTPISIPARTARVAARLCRARPLATLLLTLLLLAGGCVRYTPERLDTRAELAALRQHSPVVIVEQGDPNRSPLPATRPFDPTDGLDESELIAVALSLNPDLRATRLKVGQARSQLIAAGLWPNPELGLGLRGGIGGSSGTVIDIDILFELLRAGERDTRRQLARQKIAEAHADTLAAELELVAQVRAQWLAVRVAEQTASLLRDDAALRQKAADLIKRSRELGEASELDVSLGGLDLAESRRELRKAEADIAVARRELNRLLGLPPEYAMKLTDSGKPLTIRVFADLNDDAIDRQLLAGRPELRASEAAYAATEQELRAAILKQYPSLKVGPSFGRELDGGNSLGLGISLELPIFDRNQGEIAERINLRQQARAKHIALLHRLRAGAFDARARVRTARAELDELSRELLPLLGRNREMVDAAFSKGELNVIDYLAARQRALKAQRAHLDTVAEYRNAVVRLESALGWMLGATLEDRATRPSTQPANPFDKSNRNPS